MKTIKYLFRKNIRFYFSLILGCFFSAFILLTFSTEFNKRELLLETYNNCDVDIVAYNYAPLKTNSYVYFAKDKYIKFSSSSAKILNANVYQFMEGQEYSSLSLLNEKNVIKGDYSILEKNEIAIPKYLEENYNLAIGDNLYLQDGTKLTIKYIFADIYDVYFANYNSTSCSVFVGIDTFEIAKDQMYCSFEQNVDGYKMESLYLVKKTATDYLLKYSIITVCLVLLFQCFISLFRTKSEINAFRKMKLDGVKRIYSNVMLVEGIYIFTPFLLISLFLLLGFNLTIFINIIISCLVFYMLRILYIVSRCYR